MNDKRQPQRRVDSGTWPLYLFCLGGLLIAGVFTLITGVTPVSVATQNPAWGDWVYTIGQPLGALVVLIALLFVHNLIPSLQLERIGCAINVTVGFFYAASVMGNNGAPPTTGATWLVICFAGYSLWRMHEISKAFGFDVLKPFRRKGVDGA